MGKWYYLGTIVWLLSSCHTFQAGPDHTSWADSVADKAYDRMGGSSPESSLMYLDSIYNVTPGRGIGDWWRKYNAKINYYENYAHDLNRRNLYVDSLFSILKGVEHKYPYEYAHSLSQRASALREAKQFTQAFQYYYDATDFARQNLDNCSLIDFSNSLGVICYQQEQYRKAIPYLKQAFEEGAGCVRNTNFYYAFILPQAILNTIGLCYEKSGDPDSACVYYKQALAYIDSHSGNFPEKHIFILTAAGVVKGNLGGVYAAAGKEEEAEKYLKESIDINDHPDFAMEDAQTAKLKLANLYFHLGKLPQTDSLLQDLNADLTSGRGKSISNIDLWQELYYLRWQLYEKEGKIENAYRSFQRYHIFTDSINEARNGLKYADIDQAHKAHEQRWEIALLQKNGEVKTAYLITTILVLLMTIGIAVFAWSHLRRSKLHVQKLLLINNQLNSAMLSLKKSQEDNAKMMKIAAHDLRNPVGAMLSGVGLMLAEGPRPEKELRLLQLMKTSGENSLALITDLLQVNTEVKELEKELVDLQPLLQYCVSLLQHKAEQKKQKIELHAFSVLLLLSQEKMWRVMSNLIGNAIKFSPPGTSIIVSLQRERGQVLISVKDQGIGIPEEIREKVFDMFTPAKRKGTSGEESYGLGLAVSKHIVEAHGGRIWFQTGERIGTTFFISFEEDGSGSR